MKNEGFKFKVLNIFAFTAMVAVNVLAQALPLGGYTTAEISAMYPTLLTPAPVTFAIWSVIYALLAGVLIQQLITSKDDATKKTGWMFAVSCALNILWIVFWHFRLQLFATIVIAGLWISLMLLSNNMDGENRLLKAAFRIYYAWITVAAAAQIYILLSANLPGIHTKAAAVIITTTAIALLTIFGLVKILGEKDGFFGITIIWALAGIFINHVGPGYNGMYLSIVLVSGICAVLLLSAIVYNRIRARKMKMIPSAEA